MDAAVEEEFPVGEGPASGDQLSASDEALTFLSSVGECDTIWLVHQHHQHTSISGISLFSQSPLSCRGACFQTLW